MRCWMLVLLVGCSNNDAKDREIAALKSRLAASQPSTLPEAPRLPPIAAAPPKGPQELSIDQLDTMFTAGANGPDDIKRAEDKYRGLEVLVRGTVYKSSVEMKTITLKGADMSYADCQFEVFPEGLMPGEPAAFRGIIGGYSLETMLDHCSVVARSPAKAAPREIPPAASPSPIDPRAELLLRLCVHIEERGEATLHNLGIAVDSVIDDVGHISDPSSFCELLRAKCARRYGHSSQAALVSSFGADIGTQVWNGTLCSPPIAVPRPPPSRDDLVKRLAAKITRHIGGYARDLHLAPSEILDDRGGLRDPAALAAKIKASIVKRYNKRGREVLMQSWNFGSELGAAIFSGRFQAP